MDIMLIHTGAPFKGILDADIDIYGFPPPMSTFLCLHLHVYIYIYIHRYTHVLLEGGWSRSIRGQHVIPRKRHSLVPRI